MTDEKMAEEYARPWKTSLAYVSVKEAHLAGLKAGRPKWHKVADGDLPKGDDSFGKTSIHRKIYLKDRDGNLYTGNYYPKDKYHSQDCFAVEFLDWGLKGANFCVKEQISEWCEIPQYTEE
jgi:hypothetical protein